MAETGNFNIGSIRGFNEEKAISAMEKAEEKVGSVNTEGVKLQEKFSYKNTLDAILEHINL